MLPGVHCFLPRFGSLYTSLLGTPVVPFFPFCIIVLSLLKLSSRKKGTVVGVTGEPSLYYGTFYWGLYCGPRLWELIYTSFFFPHWIDRWDLF